MNACAFNTEQQTMGIKGFKSKILLDLKILSLEHQVHAMDHDTFAWGVTETLLL